MSFRIFHIYYNYFLKVEINVPVFKDKNTPDPFIENDMGCPDAKQAIKPDHIYMDCMGFGKLKSNLKLQFSYDVGL